MNASAWFQHEPKWSPSEKKAARRAFDRAFEKQCAALLADVKKMIAGRSSPVVIWEVHDYLSTRRKAVDETFDYRYSVLLEVFAKLLREGWLTEADLSGLQEDKLEKIKRWANI